MEQGSRAERDDRSCRRHPRTERGTANAGDARLLARILAPERAGTDASYLAVSARTPHNRFPLPELSLSASAGGDDPVALTPAVDPALGYHYGAEMPGAASEPLTLTPTAPPQITRHEGYETAFLSLPSSSLP